jgi:hypothetical protein
MAGGLLVKAASFRTLLLLAAECCLELPKAKVSCCPAWGAASTSRERDYVNALSSDGLQRRSGVLAHVGSYNRYLGAHATCPQRSCFGAVYWLVCNEDTIVLSIVHMPSGALSLCAKRTLRCDRKASEECNRRALQGLFVLRPVLAARPLAVPPLHIYDRY